MRLARLSIREAPGPPTGHHTCRNFGVLIGVRKHLSIKQEHDDDDLEDLKGCICHLTAKLFIRGRDVKFKIIDLYTPSNSETQTRVFAKVRS